MDARSSSSTDSEAQPLLTDPSLPLSRTLAVEDLSRDELLRNVPRERFSGRDVPSLGKVFLLARIGKGGALHRRGPVLGVAVRSGAQRGRGVELPRVQAGARAEFSRHESASTARRAAAGDPALASPCSRGDRAR